MKIVVIEVYPLTGATWTVVGRRGTSRKKICTHCSSFDRHGARGLRKLLHVREARDRRGRIALAHCFEGNPPSSRNGSETHANRPSGRAGGLGGACDQRHRHRALDVMGKALLTARLATAGRQLPADNQPYGSILFDEARARSVERFRAWSSGGSRPSSSAGGRSGRRDRKFDEQLVETAARPSETASS